MTSGVTKLPPHVGYQLWSTLTKKGYSPFRTVEPPTMQGEMTWPWSYSFSFGSWGSGSILFRKMCITFFNAGIAVEAAHWHYYQAVVELPNVEKAPGRNKQWLGKPPVSAESKVKERHTSLLSEAFCESLYSMEWDRCEVILLCWASNKDSPSASL